MPEGDSLVRLAYRLRPVMEKQVLTRTDFRVPQFAIVDLSGWMVDDITPTGKYLSMLVTAPQTTETATPQLVILSHLGMDGSWQIDVQPTQHTRCLLHFSDHRIVGSSLATLDILTPDRVQEQLAFLGPDVLHPGWEQPETAEALLAQALTNFRHAPDQPVATALLDQRLVAGIGNIYRCEALLLAGISPYRLLSELRDEQLTGLIALSRDLMVLNVPPKADGRARRSTVDIRPDPHAPFGVRIATDIERARARADRSRQRRKTPRYWVYGRQRDGCLRCGGPVKLDALGTGSSTERTIYWCPHCQRN